MKNLEKLNLIYAATRRAPLSADEHDALRQHAEQLFNAIQALENPPPKTAEAPASESAAEKK